MHTSARPYLQRHNRWLARGRAAMEQRRECERRNDAVDAAWRADIERGVRAVGSRPPVAAYGIYLQPRGPTNDVDRPRERALADLGRRLGVAVNVKEYNAFAAAYNPFAAQYPEVKNRQWSTWMQTKRAYLEGRLLAQEAGVARLYGGAVTDAIRAEVAERVEEAMYGPE